MLRSVFARNLRDQRRALVGWCGGVIAYCVLIMVMYPTIRDRPDLQRVINDYPEALRKLFAITDIATPVGFLNGYLMSVMMPLLVIIYTVLTGGDATAGEEERGTLDLLLANPIRRRRVLLEKAASMAVGATLLGCALFATVVAVAPLVDLSVPYAHFAEAVAAMVLVAVEFGIVAMVVGAGTGRRGVARGIAAAAAAGGYLVSSLSTLVPAVHRWRVVSPYYHAIGTDPLGNGLSILHTGALIAGLAVLTAAGVWLFERRDLAP